MKETSGQLKEYIEDRRSRNMHGEVGSQKVYIRNRVKKQNPG
jgi:hypothetical protein